MTEVLHSWQPNQEWTNVAQEYIQLNLGPIGQIKFAPKIGILKLPTPENPAKWTPVLNKSMIDDDNPLRNHYYYEYRVPGEDGEYGAEFHWLRDPDKSEFELHVFDISSGDHWFLDTKLKKWIIVGDSPDVQSEPVTDIA